MLHFAFTGVGWIVPVITFGLCLGMELLTVLVFGKGYYQQHGWPILLAFLAAAVAIRLILALFSNLTVTRQLRDMETGQLVTLHPRHSFFFVPLRFWPVTLAVLGIAIFVGVELHLAN